MGKVKHKQIKYMSKITHLDVPELGLEPMALTIMQYGVLLSLLDTKVATRLEPFPITMS